MVSLTRFQILSTAAANYAFFVVLLALHVLRALVLLPPWDTGVAWWVIANTVAFGANAFVVPRRPPQLLPNSCPYCGKQLQVSLLRCEEHGDLVPKKSS